ncbi:valine--tRNA ligase [Candidatus Saccharibacteria bacterium]|nr:valine--tRNA ligase [Candidatus Saccharibacteria bacterium]
MRLPKAYNPAEHEADIYALWEKRGAFQPESRRQTVDNGQAGDYFSIVMPPPNANANLHIGFGLTIAIEDTVVRYQRMQGKSTLFIPGADHAGFETQVVYEKKLEEQGKSRFDFSREELYKQIWDFVEKNKHNFQSQIRALGASCDWTRFTYTLDNKVIAQSYKTFNQMWDDGLIYRGKRIVNYCTFHGTSFSDIEVVHEEEETQLWRIAYPLVRSPDASVPRQARDKIGVKEIIVATTRPESMLGDTAVAVHPDDKRYKDLIGKTVKLPLVGREIPIVADEMVDVEFGTGAVKVTPAHDPNDFELAQRHNLPLIDVITTEGKVSQDMPKQFRGLTVVEAREAVAEELAKKGFLRGVESYTHSVGKCYKCGTVIEPLALEQWFVNMEDLKKPALAALEKKEITFYPDSKRRQLIRYLEGLKDWNISRQIAWGIPIPAFQNIEDASDWIFDTRVEQETIEVGGKKYKRDPDVFDTWFSSSSWPYSTLNYPEGEEFKNFYPTSLMETAGEILHQWVARMIMLGLYTTGKVPFNEVYIHGLVLAEGGAKMSKSLGNVVDAMEVIAEHGSDALRMGLIAGRAAAVNRGYDRRRVGEARNFANKLWNVARFVENQGATSKDVNYEAKSIADHWILNKLSICISEVSKYMAEYRLSESYEAIYHFVWDDLADWYIEASKAESNPPFSRFILEKTLKLTHPFAPFVTEVIWQTMGGDEDNLLMTQTMGDIPAADKSLVEQFESLKQIVTEVRKISTALGLNKPRLVYSGGNQELIKGLANLSEIVQNDSPVGLKLTSSDAWLDVDKETAKGYLLKLEREKMARQSAIQALEGRLNNKSYIDKAPKELVEQSRSQLETEKAQLAKIEEDLKNFTEVSLN